MNVWPHLSSSDQIIVDLVSSLDAIFILHDLDYKPIYWNNVARHILPTYFEAIENGTSLKQARKNLIKVLLPDLPSKNMGQLSQQIRELQISGKSYEFVGENKRIYIYKNLQIGGDRILGIGIDVTDISEYEARRDSTALEAIQIANTDHLTGLPNRRHFLEILNTKCEHARIHDEALHLGLMDLNKFKLVNDHYGHGAGDELLQIVGSRLQKFNTDRSMTARLGGDEFAILCWDQNEDNLLVYGETLCAEINQPFMYDGKRVNISSSLGWASFPSHGKNRSELMKKSDFALYKSKVSDPSQPVIFNKAHETDYNRQAAIGSELMSASIFDELTIYFQPIHNVKSKAILGFEALARWYSPRLGWVPPNEFIPLAEKTGRIRDLTPVLFGKALEIAKNWPKHMRLQFNLSGLDICSHDTVSRLIAIKKSANVQGLEIIFEVTETEIIENFTNIKAIQKSLLDEGINLYLDDFGSGYSNLTYLNQINVSGLKIDKEFLDRDNLSLETVAILESIKFLCDTLNLELTIEGVETKDQLELLASLDLTHIQGFYFSKPMPPEDLAAYILTHTLANASTKETLPQSKRQDKRKKHA